MAEPRPAHGQRGGERDPLVGLARERGEPARDVDVGRGEHARLVEGRQQAGGGDRAARVVAVDHAAASSLPASSSADSSVTSAGSGFQAKTPQRPPAVTGVSGPSIPRTKRYRTPAMSRPGS